MPEKFKPKDDPQFPFVRGWTEEIMNRHKDKLSDIENAINANMSIKDFLELFDEVVIVLSIISSGLEVAKLNDMEIDEWTW